MKVQPLRFELRNDAGDLMSEHRTRKKALARGKVLVHRRGCRCAVVFDTARQAVVRRFTP